MTEDPVDVDAGDGSEDEGGLEFIDPEEIRKKELAEAAANKDQNQKPKMVLINGVLVPASTVSLNKGPSVHHGQGGKAAQKAPGRSALFNSIMDRVKQKTSKNFDLAQLQSTFKTQDLHSKKKGQENVTVVDALAHELERGPADGDGVDEFPDDESDQQQNGEAAGGPASQADAADQVHIP